MRWNEQILAATRIIPIFMCGCLHLPLLFVLPAVVANIVCVAIVFSSMGTVVLPFLVAVGKPLLDSSSVTVPALAVQFWLPVQQVYTANDEATFPGSFVRAVS